MRPAVGIRGRVAGFGELVPLDEVLVEAVEDEEAVRYLLNTSREGWGAEVDRNISTRRRAGGERRDWEHGFKVQARPWEGNRCA